MHGSREADGGGVTCGNEGGEHGKNREPGVARTWIHGQFNRESDQSIDFRLLVPRFFMLVLFQVC